MVELSQKHEVYEADKYFEHRVIETYPKENVANMKKSWEKGIKQYKEWLENCEENMKKIIDNAIEQIDETARILKKSMEEFENLSKEKQIERLFKKYEEEKKKAQEYLDNLDKKKEETRNAIKMNYEKYKQEAKQKIKSLQNALKVWNNVKRI